jgi:DNA-binding PadR family transcriptional regulator
MKKVNKSRYAILGMLFDQPLSGYELRKRMLSSTTYFWNETDASVYPMLRILEEEGMVTAKTEFVGKRARKVFTITQAGKDDVTAWLALPAEQEHPRSELLLKLFFGAFVCKEITIKQLEQRLQQCQETQKTFKTIENEIAQAPDTHPQKLFWELSVRRGTIDVEATITWLNECLERLKRNNEKKIQN